MPIQNAYRYSVTKINIDQFFRDTLNEYLVVSQRPYRGKTDLDGKIIIEPGANITLQIIRDISEPIIDKKTGEIKENNELETFEVTIEGCQYPLPLKKGDKVSLGDFDEENSYYINFNLILRFRKIKLIEE